MSDIVVNKLDSVYMKIDCERSIAKELSSFFTFKVPGHKYMPAYRNKIWDGTIKLFNTFDFTLYNGLLEYLKEFSKERNYTLEYSKEDFFSNDTKSMEDVRKYMTEYLKPQAHGKAITPHEHQISGVCHAINNGRALLLSPTGSGKSFIIYSLLRYYLSKTDKKILVIVPTTSLVSQMFSDFKEYSSGNGWSVDNNVHTIMGGRDKETDKRVVVSTWQSIFRQPKEYFDQFGAVFGDECHLFKAKSLTSIMSNLRDCDYRIGTTGTLDGSQTHKLVIEGLFGPTKKVTTTKKLMEKNLLTNLKIDSILLDYDTTEKQLVKKMKYQDEIKWIIGNEKRNTFISNLTKSLNGNTLVLFQFVESHGKKLHSMIDESTEGRQVFFVYGKTDVEQREQVRHITENESNAIIVASYGTFSTGISIRNLKNIIFASPSKSRIRVLQSIGRQLRKSDKKDLARLYDIGDDLSWKSYKNHTLRHFMERMKIYKSEGFDFKLVNIPLKGGRL